MLSEKEKKKIQWEKELNSLRNKMGSNLVWFDSLSKKKQFDILFLWKNEKATNKLTKPEITYVKRKTWKNGRRAFITVKVVNYPPNIKHFIKDIRKLYRFMPDISSLRNSAIDILLSAKK